MVEPQWSHDARQWLKRQREKGRCKLMVLTVNGCEQDVLWRITDRTAVAGYRSGGEEVNISFCGFDACGVLWSTRCARDDVFSRESIGKRFN